MVDARKDDEPVRDEALHGDAYKLRPVSPSR
jgi:hypothetical protein